MAFSHTNKGAIGIDRLQQWNQNHMFLACQRTYETRTILKRQRITVKSGDDAIQHFIYPESAYRIGVELALEMSEVRLVILTVNVVALNDRIEHLQKQVRLGHNTAMIFQHAKRPFHGRFAADQENRGTIVITQ